MKQFLRINLVIIFGERSAEGRLQGKNFADRLFHSSTSPPKSAPWSSRVSSSCSSPGGSSRRGWRKPMTTDWRAEVTKRITSAHFSLIYIKRRGEWNNIPKLFRTFATVNNKFDSIMSEKQKQVTEQREQMRTRSQSAESQRNSTKGQVEKERKAVLQLLLEKTGLKYKELVDAQVGMWMAGNLDLLTTEEKKQFPHLVF